MHDPAALFAPTRKAEKQDRETSDVYRVVAALRATTPWGGLPPSRRPTEQELRAIARGGTVTAEVMRWLRECVIIIKKRFILMF